MVLLSCSICVSYPQPHKSLVHTATRIEPRFFLQFCQRAVTHTRSVSSRSLHTDTCRCDDCPLSDPRPLSLFRSLAATFAPGDLRSLGYSRAVGIVLTLTDLALSCRSSLTQRRADSRHSLDSSRSLSDLFVLAPSVASPAPIELLRSCFLQLRAHSNFCCTLL